MRTSVSTDGSGTQTLSPTCTVWPTGNAIVCAASQPEATRWLGTLESLAQTERISLDQVIAIGDGANDLDMLARAGLGIAFRAKRIVQQQAKYALNQQNLDAVLYLLGLHDEEVRELASLT